jgi:hypothetical protein
MRCDQKTCLIRSSTGLMPSGSQTVGVTLTGKSLTPSLFHHVFHQPIDIDAHLTLSWLHGRALLTSGWAGRRQRRSDKSSYIWSRMGVIIIWLFSYSSFRVFWSHTRWAAFLFAYRPHNLHCGICSISLSRYSSFFPYWNCILAFFNSSRVSSEHTSSQNLTTVPGCHGSSSCTYPSLWLAVMLTCRFFSFVMGHLTVK